MHVHNVRLKATRLRVASAMAAELTPENFDNVVLKMHAAVDSRAPRRLEVMLFEETLSECGDKELYCDARLKEFSHCHSLPKLKLYIYLSKHRHARSCCSLCMRAQV